MATFLVDIFDVPMFISAIMLLHCFCMIYKDICGHRALAYYVSVPCWFLFFGTPLVVELVNANVSSNSILFYNTTSMYLFMALISGMIKENLTFPLRNCLVTYVGIFHGWWIRHLYTSSSIYQKMSMHLLLNVVLYAAGLIYLTSVECEDDITLDEDDLMSDDEVNTNANQENIYDDAEDVIIDGNDEAFINQNPVASEEDFHRVLNQNDPMSNVENDDVPNEENVESINNIIQVIDRTNSHLQRLISEISLDLESSDNE